MSSTTHDTETGPASSTDNVLRATIDVSLISAAEMTADRIEQALAQFERGIDPLQGAAKAEEVYYTPGPPANSNTTKRGPHSAAGSSPLVGGEIVSGSPAKKVKTVDGNSTGSNSGIRASVVVEGDYMVGVSDGQSNNNNNNNEPTDSSKDAALARQLASTPGSSLLMSGNTITAVDDVVNKIGARDDVEIQDEVFYAAPNSLSMRLIRMRDEVNTALSTLVQREKDLAPSVDVKK